MLNEFRKKLGGLADKEKAKILQRFFKTGKGEYGEGDIFLGITVPIQREVAKKFLGLRLDDLQKLLDSKIHEERMIALFILVDKYKKADASWKKNIFNFYTKNYSRINNWDLVDLSAPNIVGDFLLDRNRKILYAFAKSDNLWKKRIAIISTFAFIRNNEFKDSIKLAEILLNDKHDLIHKAVGWMLREIGKRDKKELIKFLNKNSVKMPRTMLRYSIEKFPEKERKKYLNK
jgi:3-methyladenine DNA glycosylase AlkD